MDPLATLLMLAAPTGHGDRLELRGAMTAWVRSGGFKVPAADLRAKGVSNQRIAAWLRMGWVV